MNACLRIMTHHSASRACACSNLGSCSLSVIADMSIQEHEHELAVPATADGSIADRISCSLLQVGGHCLSGMLQTVHVGQGIGIDHGG